MCKHRPLKIALLSSLYHPYQVGGAELTTQLIAEGLARRGDEVTVITLSCESKVEQRKHNGVTVLRIPLWNAYWPSPVRKKPLPMRALWHAIDTFNPVAARSVYKALVAFQPNLVQTHNLAGFSTAVWFSARRLQIPVVHVIHDYYLLCPRSSMVRRNAVCATQCATCRLARVPQRAASGIIAAVVGVSKFVLETHLRAGLFPASLLHKVIYNGYDRPQGNQPSHVSCADEPLRIGFLGQIHRIKGLETLLRAISRLPPHRFRLEVGGTGAAEYLKHLLAAFPQSNIRFLGKVSPPEFLARLDLLCVPSLWHEPFGRVVIEAYAHGVPVIGSRVGGITDLIDEGATGMLVQPGDVEAIVTALGKCDTSPGLLLQMRQKALAKAKEFATGRTVEGYAALYQELMSMRLDRP